MKLKILLIQLMIFLVLFQSGCGEKEPVYLETAVTEHTENSEMEDTEGYEPTEQVSGGFCYVYVCGAVNSPGVYELAEGSRIYEAVQMAGGLREDACAESVNQAECLMDGQMIKILTEEEAIALDEKSTMADAESSDGRININTASVTELMTLPGVGQSKAEAIIAYREEHGAFSAIEEVMNVTGIKEGVYNQMKDHIKTD